MLRIYLPIKSISIAVSAVIAVLRVGSRSGAHNDECSPGRTVPDCAAAANFAGSTPPTNYIVEATPASVYSEKSSNTIFGGISTTFVSPRILFSIPTSRWVSSGSL